MSDTVPVEVDGDGLTARIRTRLPALPPASARVARLALDDPETVSRSTIQQLAALAGTSEATIVRAARALGFRGYADLRLALAAAGGQRRRQHQVTGDIDAHDSIREVIEKISGAEQQAIRETASHIDAAVIEQIADAVAAARRVVVYGAGASGLVAADLDLKLLRIGLASRASADHHVALTEASLLTTGDVAIAVSSSGRTGEAVSFLQAAGGAGATTVAITGARRSPLTASAGHVLFAAGRDSVFRAAALSSRISQLMAIDCLFVAVAQRTYDDTTRAVVTTREALRGKRDG